MYFNTRTSTYISAFAYTPFIICWKSLSAYGLVKNVLMQIRAHNNNHEHKCIMNRLARHLLGLLARQYKKMISDHSVSLPILLNYPQFLKPFTKLLTNAGKVSSFLQSTILHPDCFFVLGNGGTFFPFFPLVNSVRRMLNRHVENI